MSLYSGGLEKLSTLNAELLLNCECNSGVIACQSHNGSRTHADAHLSCSKMASRHSNDSSTSTGE